MEKTDGTIIQFLEGSHSYEGVWFPFSHPEKEGKFWWRPILREYFRQQIQDAARIGFGAGTEYNSTHEMAEKFAEKLYTTKYGG